MRSCAAVLAAGAFAASMLWATSAQAAAPYYVRGEFNSWGTSHELADMGGGHYQLTVTGQTAGGMSAYKLADGGWSESWPGSDGKIQWDGSGSATFHLWLNPAADGWSPAGTSRAGYDDNGLSWEIMGAFNGWSSPVVGLTHEGGGLHSGTLVVPTAGTYEFKFRKAGTWDINIGDNFGNSAGNASYTTTQANELIEFELDLPNGRWRVTTVPEPASMALVAAGLLSMAARRRQTV